MQWLLLNKGRPQSQRPRLHLKRVIVGQLGLDLAAQLDQLSINIFKVNSLLPLRHLIVADRGSTTGVRVPITESQEWLNVSPKLIVAQ